MQPSDAGRFNRPRLRIAQLGCRSCHTHGLTLETNNTILVSKVFLYKGLYATPHGAEPALGT